MSDWLSDINLLSKEFYRFDFFQLDTFLSHIQSAAKKDGHEIKIFYCSMWRQSFAASDVVDFRFNADKKTISIKVAFFSLGGSNGPLPQPYIQYILDQVRSGNESITSFFDIFHHRFLELLLDIHKRFSFGFPELNDSKQKDSDVEFIDFLGYLNGIGRCMDLEKLGWFPHFPVSYFPIVQNSISALRSLVCNVFKEDPEIEEGIGGWRKIPESICNILGKKNSLVGQNLYLGKKAWVNNSSIRITVDTTFQYHLKDQCRDIEFIKKFLELVRVYSDDIDLNITLVIYITDTTTADIILKSAKSKPYSGQALEKDAIISSRKLSEISLSTGQNNILGVNTYFKDFSSRFILRYVSRLLV